MQQLPLASCRLCCHGLFFLACVPEHDWMFQHVHVLGWDISVVKHKNGVGGCPEWGYLARWTGCAVEGRVSAVPGGCLVDERKLAGALDFFVDVKRWFKSITEGCITKVSSSRTPSGFSWKPLGLPGVTGQWVSPAHLTHLRRLCPSPALSVTVGSWMVAHRGAHRGGTHLPQV